MPHVLILCGIVLLLGEGSASGQDAEAPAAPAASPRVYVATARGILYALDLNTGYTVAKFDLQETVASPMAIQDEVLFVVTQDWVVRAVDFKGETPFVRWTYTVGKPVKAGLLAHSGRLVVCTEREKGKGQGGAASPLMAISSRSPPTAAGQRR